MKIRRAGNSSVVVLALSAVAVVIAACNAAPPQSVGESPNPGAPAD